ncbi:ABC transporter ATP-binding protein [Clostridiales bacterium COT073_COT-073]|nr:ABC transporter ATP-binding protein [Clostridiales bacterium COT073_COT-073]
MVIQAKNVVKRYKEVTALDYFGFEANQGEIVGLLGPNGSGKTTFIHCALSLLTFDKGEIKLFGRQMTPEAYDIKRKIGVVPQEVSVFDNLNVQENIDYFCGLYIDDVKTRRQRVEEALEFTELTKYRKFLPKKLSGGLKRRLNIACGIAHKPELIFLDEPTVAVDAQSRNFILEGIRNLNREGATIIYTTHYLEEAENLCKKIIIMDKGRNIAEGSPEELKERICTGENIEIAFQAEPDGLLEKLEQLPEIHMVQPYADGYLLQFTGRGNNLGRLLNFIEKEDLIYKHFYIRQPSLNDVFLELTGKELRE